MKNPLSRSQEAKPTSNGNAAPSALTSPAYGGNGSAADVHVAADVFEPPSGLLIEAIQFHKLLIAAFAVLGALIGAGLGLAREPVYTAAATLQVGEVNPNSPGFGSYTQSATSLATGFSRAIVAGPVLAEVQSKLGVAPKDSASRLSAEPIPLSPVFRVIATGSSESSALKLANVTAGAVVGYVSKSNSAIPQSTSLLTAYGRAALDLKRAGAAQESLEAKGSASADALLRAEVATSTAKVELDAIERSYLAAVSSQAPRTGLVTVLAGAVTASSDRNSKIALFAFLGLLAGLLAGCVAAVWRERRPSSLGSPAAAPAPS